MIRTIACEPSAREMTLEVGVADGDWRNSLSFLRHENQSHYESSRSDGHSNGTWSGSVRTIRAATDIVPLAFSYTERDDYETRLTYERDDGSIEVLKGEGTDSNNGLRHSLTTLPTAEFQRIKQFHVQSRRYQWIEFRNISLQLGHRTKVEVR